MARKFECGPARRERTLIAIGIIGPSGSGKTKSALRLADGMARVGGGETWLVDTNNRRSLHHAEDHRFKVLHMPPPYSPDDYGAAFDHAIKAGARRIIVDSMSDEWEGEGGVLDMHEDELERRCGKDYQKRERANQACWIPAKRAHNKLKLWMFNQPVDWILNFRAKEKVKPKAGQGIESIGWQPLGAEDMIYELLVKCLLRPQADGRPTWSSNIVQEQQLMKLPGWFRDLAREGTQLSEDLGERFARWAAGGEERPTERPTSAPSQEAGPVDVAALVARFDACASREDFEAVDRDVRALLDRIPEAARAPLTDSALRAMRRYKGARGT